MDEIDRRFPKGAVAAVSAISAETDLAYNCAMDHIDNGFKKHYAGQREVAHVIADKMNVMADSLAVSCADITQDDETTVDAVTLPWNHYEAILRLYTTNRLEYYVVLKAAERFKKMKLEKSTEYRKHLEETCM
jgi:hypothetical protein